MNFDFESNLTGYWPSLIFPFLSQVNSTKELSALNTLISAFFKIRGIICSFNAGCSSLSGIELSSFITAIWSALSHIDGNNPILNFGLIKSTLKPLDFFICVSMKFSKYGLLIRAGIPQ